MPPTPTKCTCLTRPRNISQPPSPGSDELEEVLGNLGGRVGDAARAGRIGHREALASAIARKAHPGLIARLQQVLEDHQALTNNTVRDFDEIGKQLAATDTALIDLTAQLAFFGFGA